MSELPKTLEGMEDAWQRVKSREIDRDAIIAIHAQVRKYGPRAFGDGAAPAKNNAEMMDVAKGLLNQYLRALGLTDHDIDTLNKSTKWSGSWYPNASIPMNTLQYGAPPFLTAAGLPKISLGVRAAAAGLGFLPTGMFQQPLAVLPSEHSAERHGPLISVDKDNVNYENYRPIIADLVKVQALAHAVVGSRFNEGVRLAKLQAAWDDSRERAADFLSRLPARQREQLRALTQEMVRSVGNTHAAHKKLMATEGAHHRQTLGAKNQIAPRVMRPVGQGALGLLSGVDVDELSKTLTPAQVQKKLDEVGRKMRLPPMTVAGLQALWFVATQGWQNAGAAFDETNKVHYKAMLNMAYADDYTAQGQRKIERGEQPGPEDLDVKKCRSRVQAPVESLEKRVEKHLKSEISKLPEGSPARGAMEQDLDHLTHGRFSQLDRQGIAARMMLEAANHSVFRSFFSSDGVLRRDIAAKRNRDEHTVQWVQRGTQTWHGGVFGSAVSNTSTAIGTTAKGGAGDTPTGLLVGLLVLNVALGVIAAVSAAETQTLKNFGKEGKMPADAEGGTARRPGTAGQVGRGLISGIQLIKGKWKAADANEMVRSSLQMLATPAAQAQILSDAFAAYDEAVAAARNVTEIPDDPAGKSGPSGSRPKQPETSEAAAPAGDRPQAT